MEKIWKHFKLITKHKWIVFKLSIKAGIPFRGLVHDLSKYSITEFWESAKYYQGNRSPIVFARKENVYSKAWLHHKGRNKHHEEYWYDWYAEVKAPIIPYKYTIEMVCDQLAAGIVYNGDDWKQNYPLKYWTEKKNKDLYHSQMVKFFEDLYTEIAEHGIDKVINKKNLKEKYEKYCVNYLEEK